MMRLFKFCLVLPTFLSFTFLSFAQGFPTGGFYPPASSQHQKERIEQLKKENPKLAEFEQRLLDINNETQEILNDYREGKLSKEEARSRLTPLMKEKMEITSNPDYLVEQQLGMFLATPPPLPDFRK